MSVIAQYPLKIPKEILDAVRQSAEKNSRSVNKEIEFALKQYLRKNDCENPQSKD